jgi:UDP-N-acetylglucosamine acyltransferase
MITIHPSAVVAKTAKLSEGVSVGPFCTVGPNVELGPNVKLISHVAVDGFTTIGEDCELYPFASIGMQPQDLKFSGEESRLIIGKNNKIREYVTMQPGTKDGDMLTTVGDNCLFMGGVHIAHDCQIGSNIIMANYATLGGHVHVEDRVIIGGLAAVHQFVRIGKGAMIGGMAGINSDVIPYALVMGDPSGLSGLNIVGLRRSGIDKKSIESMLKAYQQIFESQDDTLEERTNRVANDYLDHPFVVEIIEFMRAQTSRSVCLPKR